MIDFNTVRQYNFPTLIRFGAGAIKELPEHLKASGLAQPLIVTDPVVKQLSFFKEIIDSLSARSISAEVFSDIHKNPVKSDVIKGGEIFTTTKRDSIIGIGGGAAMDVARAIALRINHHRDLFDYDDLIGGDKYVTEEVPYFITVPTTSGTGSEVGRSAIISEDDTHRKRILFSPKLLAKLFLLIRYSQWICRHLLQPQQAWMHSHTIWKRFLQKDFIHWQMELHWKEFI